MNAHRTIFRSSAVLTLVLACATGGWAEDPLHAWTAGADPAALETWVNARLAAVKADVDKVAAVKGDHTIANTVRPYDDALNQLSLGIETLGGRNPPPRAQNRKAAPQALRAQRLGAEDG